MLVCKYLVCRYSNRPVVAEWPFCRDCRYDSSACGLLSPWTHSLTVHFASGARVVENTTLPSRVSKHSNLPPFLS